MHPTARLATAALVFAFAACSSTVASSDGGSDQPPATDVPIVDVPIVDAPIVDSTADVTPDMPAPMSPCPRTEPAEGTPCTRGNLDCEYGADPRRECRNVAFCDGTMWRIRSPIITGISGRPWCTSPPPPATCPSTFDAAMGQTCSAQGAVCTYAGTLCECTSCVSFPLGTCTLTRTWQCDGRPAGRCPAASPRFGDACIDDGLECSYGCNSPSGSMQCAQGVWQRGSFRDCPISTRRVKRDISYLTPAEVDALASQLRATRLATWEYTIPSMAGRRHLGFILEDQPHSYSVDPEHSQVDLYGFASMLAATVQSQDRQIRALHQRLDALEHRGAAQRR